MSGPDSALAFLIRTLVQFLSQAGVSYLLTPRPWQLWHYEDATP